MCGRPACMQGEQAVWDNLMNWLSTTISKPAVQECGIAILAVIADRGLANNLQLCSPQLWSLPALKQGPLAAASAQLVCAAFSQGAFLALELLCLLYSASSISCDHSWHCSWHHWSFPFDELMTRLGVSVGCRSLSMPCKAFDAFAAVCQKDVLWCQWVTMHVTELLHDSSMGFFLLSQCVSTRCTGISASSYVSSPCNKQYSVSRGSSCAAVPTMGNSTSALISSCRRRCFRPREGSAAVIAEACTHRCSR